MFSKKARTGILVTIIGIAIIAAGLWAQPQGRQQAALTDEQKIVEAMHLIQSQTLYDYVKELVSEKYAGRLAGTPEYDNCVNWVIGLLQEWGVQPGGEKGTYLQSYPNPYTLVLKGGSLTMDVPVNSGIIKKVYKYEEEFLPGGTSGSGEVSAEVIYVGYGITAPELGYDDYAGVDVKGKIVLMDPEAPMGAADTDVFRKWRPFSFHQHKLENAVAHGAKGMIYNYGPIVNPNNSYREGFIYHHVKIGDRLPFPQFPRGSVGLILS